MIFLDKRSFILGLGVGIIFTSIVVWIAYGVSDSNDVAVDGIEVSTEIVQDNQGQDELEETTAAAPAHYEAETMEKETVIYSNIDPEEATKSEGVSSDNSGKAKNSKNDKDINSNKNKSGDDKKQDASDDSQPNSSENEQKENVQSDTPNSGDDLFAEITISSGANARKVSTALAEKGVIDNASDYEKYLVNNKKTTNIKTGTFKIPKGTDFENITSIITKKK